MVINIKEIRYDILPYSYILGYFIFNLFHYSNVFTLSHDSIYYYSEILNNLNTLHPHHLLFIPFCTIVNKILEVICCSSNTIFNIIIINNFFGCLTLIFIYKLLKYNFQFSFYCSFVSIILTSLSYGFWFYNCNIETYHIPLALSTISIYFYSKDNSIRNLVISSIIGGFAVLFHQLYILLFIILIIHYLLFKKNSFKGLIIFSIVYNLIWISGYLIAIIQLNISTINDIQHWFFKYHYEVNSWSGLSLKYLILPMIGFFRSIFTMHGFFLNNYLVIKLSTVFHNKNLVDDIFIAQITNPYFFYFYSLSIIIFFFTILFLFIKTRKKIINLIINNQKFNVLLIFFIVFAVFFSLWDSANLEFWIPQSIIFMIMIAISIDILSKKNKYIITILLASILLINNFTLTISKINYTKNDYYLTMINEIKLRCPQKALLIDNNDWIISKYFEVFSNTEFIKYEKNNQRELNKILNNDFYDFIVVDSSININEEFVLNNQYISNDTLKAINKVYYIYKLRK